jgi:putative hydroxymethylpyrimidine transport system permease protein
MIAFRALVVAAGLAVIWQAVVIAFAPPPYILPSPAAVLAALRSRPELWREDAVVTFAEALAGLILGTLIGVALALTMSFLPPTRHLLLSVTVVSQALPVILIAPLLVLWFGFGIGSKIVMATIAIFFPVTSAFHDGLARTDPQLLDLATLHGASHGQKVRLLRVPGALPALISGIRLAAVYAPTGALVGEWVGASSGLGYAILLANGRAQVDVMFAAVILLAAMSVLLRALVDIATRNLTPWAPESPA